MRYEIVPARLSHLRVLAANLRPGDRAEIDATGMKPRHLIHRLYRQSYRSECALIDGDVAAVWGWQGSLLSPTVEMWLLTTRAVERLPMAFYREGRRILAETLRTKCEIVSGVGSDYIGAIRFFGMLGFEMHESGTPMMTMTLRRPEPQHERLAA